jgi:DNA-binding NtrC family response regulator
MGEPNPSPYRTAAVLAVSPLSADLLRLHEILSPRNWTLRQASACRDALALLRVENCPVLLCERDQPDGNWKDLLSATTGLPAPPKLIVFSRLANESLWAEALNLGGFDVLITPFEEEDVLRVTFAAWSHWENDFAAGVPKKAMTRAAQENAAADAVVSDWRAAGSSA